jgi:hypothetical protein
MRDLAFLLTDSRYWSQAAEEADESWTLVRIGAPDMPNDWIEWLEVRSFNLSCFNKLNC